jgi:hypothetical protein
LPRPEFHLPPEEADAIRRLSALENMREQARSGKRTALVDNIEKLIAAELRAIQRGRAVKAADDERPGS